MACNIKSKHTRNFNSSRKYVKYISIKSKIVVSQVILEKMESPLYTFVLVLIIIIVLLLIVQALYYINYK